MLETKVMKMHKTCANHLGVSNSQGESCEALFDCIWHLQQGVHYALLDVCQNFAITIPYAHRRWHGKGKWILEDISLAHVYKLDLLFISWRKNVGKISGCHRNWNGMGNGACKMVCGVQQGGNIESNSYFMGACWRGTRLKEGWLCGLLKPCNLSGIGKPLAMCPKAHYCSGHVEDIYWGMLT